MLARLFRWIDRLGWLVVRLSAWTGSQFLAWGKSIGIGRPKRPPEADPLVRADHVETQVRSLSGLTVGLIAAVVVLILWATSPSARDNPVVSFLNLNLTPIIPDEIESEAAIPTPGPLDAGGTLVFTGRVSAQDDLFALAVGNPQPIRLTDSPADDRNPAWSPDGHRLAFASRRDGNWELYILDVLTGELTRLTYDSAFEAGPTWSPDGQWLAYEGYFEGNLDIYIVKVDGSEDPHRLTFDAAPDFSPAWTTDPTGREIAYVSWREGNQDIYILSLDAPSESDAYNLTHTSDINEEHPDWGPGGHQIAYSAIQDGTSLVYVAAAHDPAAEPFVVSQGREPTWAPDGSGLLYVADRPGGSLLLTGQVGNWGIATEAYALEGMSATDPDWAVPPLPTTLAGSLATAQTTPIEPAYHETTEDTEPPYRLSTLPGVTAEAPWLSDRVDDSFIALSARVQREAGWDFLGQLDSVWWLIDRRPEPGQDNRNWHKAGRAFDIPQAYNYEDPPQIELVREQIGVETYWRLYIRAATQDGTLGEPLRAAPWDFLARTSGDVVAYEQGGSLRPSIPTGYYIDFTQLAIDYGWERTPSHNTWRYNWPGVLYWQYEKRNGLGWWEAMLELYPEATVYQAFAPPTPMPTPTITPTPEEPLASTEEPTEPPE